MNLRTKQDDIFQEMQHIQDKINQEVRGITLTTEGAKVDMKSEILTVALKYNEASL